MQRWNSFFNNLKIVKMRETLSFFYASKLRALNYKSSQRKCAKAGTLWWDSKERRTTQRKRKNYNDRKRKQKRKRFTNTYLDKFLGNISSTDNDSDDSDGESDSNIDMLID